MPGGLHSKARMSQDIIFLDVRMPELDGYDTARHIRARWAGQEASRPRLIALTANAMPSDRELCLTAGMDEYISKPMQIDILRAMLERRGTERLTARSS
jgi:CheY-like chemotaxis protein